MDLKSPGLLSPMGLKSPGLRTPTKRKTETLTEKRFPDLGPRLSQLCDHEEEKSPESQVLDTEEEKDKVPSLSSSRSKSSEEERRDIVISTMLE